MQVALYNSLPLSKEAIVEEIQEATQQYLNCGDPVEAAARRQRVHFGEANGDVDEAATRILAANQYYKSLQQQHNFSISNLATPPPRQDEHLVMDRSISYASPIGEKATNGNATNSVEVISPVDTSPVINGRTPAVRLRSVIVSPTAEGEKETDLVGANVSETEEVPADDETLIECQNNIRRQAKRKPVRNSPNILRGTSSKKRLMSQIQNSPRRTEEEAEEGT
ncbi:zf-CCHC_4 domain-containing protein [Raphanus sativus]|nr:zf-CCHC_4 domain-containing protein [Raphanus sativus]